ncbi:MAG: hypothetical protein AABX31_04430, partial [Nanoarchaeota archaeon]
MKERVIVKEITSAPSATSPDSSSFAPPSPSATEGHGKATEDKRINKLVTDLANLTTRMDERYGYSPQSQGAYSNSALFSMISQFQRIKTLDGVTITGSTITGYASSQSVSDSYLPFTGGTLTGGLTGTTLGLSSTLNASTTAHITGLLTIGNNLTFSSTSATTTIPSSLRNAFAFATSSASAPFLSFDTTTYRVGLGTTTPGRTFSVKGNLLANLLNLSGSGTSTFTGGISANQLSLTHGFNISGGGTSTITGRLEITATSTMAGYKICTQENGVCVGGAFTSSGGYTTLRTATDLVGIGSSTPGEKLSLNGGAFFDSDIIRISSSSAASLTIKYFS